MTPERHLGYPINRRVPQQIQCKICGIMFPRRSPTNVTCSGICGVKYERVSAEKNRRRKILDNLAKAEAEANLYGRIPIEPPSEKV